MDTTPLVSILIPTFNRPHYLEQALKSALEQSYVNIEVIVCDDSTNDESFNMIKPYIQKYSNLRYYKNEPRLPGKGVANAQKCLDLASGEYINYLMDDDLFHRNKIDKMLPYLLENPKITLVTSHRQVIDENGNILPPIPSSQRLFDNTTTIDGKVIIRYILKNLVNIIGEPTTALFRKKDIENKFGFYNGIQYKCLTDLAMWIQLLSKGDGVYLPESLSCFRIHGGQNSKDEELMSLGAVESFTFIKNAFENGIISSRDEYDGCLYNWLWGNMSKVRIINRKILKEQQDMPVLFPVKELYSCFEFALKELLQLN